MKTNIFAFAKILKKVIQIGNTVFQHPPVVLAPMEDVTDSPFRRLCRKMGADWTFSEFISVEGIIHKKDHYGPKMNFLPDERPFSLQIFTSTPDNLKQALEIIEPLRPDFIDLNMGCPMRKIVSKGAGAALLRTPEMMIRIAETAVKSTPLPVTVKTRIGWDFDSIIIHELALRLQDTGIATLIIHGRTKTQLYGGQVNWDIIASVAQNPHIQIPIIGNGDINTVEQAVTYPQKYGVAGVMIGRAAIGNPFIFKQISIYRATGQLYIPDINERIDTLKEFIIQSIAWKGLKRTIFETRKHYSKYFAGLPHFKPFKLQLMNALTECELFDIFEEIRMFYTRNTH